MLGPPADAVYLWMGLGAVGVAALGFALAVPASPAPDAAGVAETVDAVAAGTFPASERHAVAARAARIEPRRLALRNDAGTAHATFRYGPVTPVPAGSDLAAVLDGDAPGAVFDSPGSLRRAAASARNRTPAWQPVEDAIVVRAVTWEGVDVTLVGA